MAMPDTATQLRKLENLQHQGAGRQWRSRNVYNICERAQMQMRSFYNFSFFQLDAHHMSSPLFLLNVTLALEEKKPDHVVASWSGPSSRSSQINVLHVITIRGCSYMT